MTALMPEIEAQLASVAEAKFSEPRLVWWRSGRMGGLTLAALLATSTAGYAARGLWRPALGMGDGPRPVAVAAPPQPGLLGAFSVLRRAQTDADRGRGAQFALTFPTNRRGVRTGFVRQLGVTAKGQPIILVPVTNAVGPDSADRNVIARGDRLCLWVQDGRTGGGRTCTNKRNAMKLGIAVMMSDPAKPDPDLERAKAAIRRR